MVLKFCEIDCTAWILASVFSQFFVFIWNGKWFNHAYIKFSNYGDKNELHKYGMERMGLRVLLGFLRTLLSVYVFAVFFTTLNIHTIAQTIGWGLLITVGFIATIGFNGVLWEGQHIEAYYFNTSSKIVGFLGPMLVYTIINGFRQDTLALF
jgi:hypothetical protein